ncbi:MAG: hypothetical protein EBX52_08200 [Proteobacteria bacterium]|nr:hypothetical protein [Pseudomonadota bacterium]
MNHDFRFKKGLIALSLCTLAACSSSPEIKKIVIDQGGSEPSWVKETKTAWEEDGKIHFRGTQQIRGNERLSGCYDLARLNAKSQIVGEIQERLRGLLTTNESTLNENVEILLTKSRSVEFDGDVKGVRFTEEYFTRYRIGDDERVDCQVLSEISKEDYSRLKRAILNKVEEADPKLKEQIRQKHLDFFKGDDLAKKSP